MDCRKIFDRVARVGWDVIFEVSLEDLVLENAMLFKEERTYGWPGPWNTSLEASRAHLASRGAKGFELSSSCDLRGWIIAESCRLERSS
jgi:hypothetical protein